MLRKGRQNNAVRKRKTHIERERIEQKANKREIGLELEKLRLQQQLDNIHRDISKYNQAFDVPKHIRQLILLEELKKLC